MNQKDKATEVFRSFSLQKGPVLSPAERAEREAKQRNPVPEREKPEEKYYQGTELHCNRGIPASRFKAFDLPSRHNDLLYYRDGRIEPFPQEPR